MYNYNNSKCSKNTFVNMHLYTQFYTQNYYSYTYILLCKYIYIYIYISSCRAAHTNFHDSLATRLYRPSLPAGLLDYIQCPYRAVVNKF